MQVVEAEEKTPTSLLLTKATKEKPSVGMVCTHIMLSHFSSIRKDILAISLIKRIILRPNLSISILFHLFFHHAHLSV